MTDKASQHRSAAARHEQAAENHDRAARYWQDKGDRDRSGLQSEMAAYERRGAELERRWAGLVESGGGEDVIPAGERVGGHTRDGAIQLSQTLTRISEALDEAARLADEHASRRELAGKRDEANQEREAARRARGGAEQARSQAEQWRNMFGDEDPNSG